MYYGLCCNRNSTYTALPLTFASSIAPKGGGLREELLKFKVSGDQGVVSGEHRAEFVPILHRVLLAKMLRRKGKTARNNPRARRSLILRFLLGLPEEEQRGFIDLTLEPFSALVAGDGTADAAEVVPLSKQLGFLHLAGDFITNLGVHLGKFLPMVLPVLLRVVQGAQGLLSRRSELHPRHVSPLRTIRLLAIKTLAKLYRSYVAPQPAGSSNCHDSSPPSQRIERKSRSACKHVYAQSYAHTHTTVNHMHTHSHSHTHTHTHTRCVLVAFDLPSLQYNQSTASRRIFSATDPSPVGCPGDLAIGTARPHWHPLGLSSSQPPLSPHSPDFSTRTSSDAPPCSRCSKCGRRTIGCGPCWHSLDPPPSCRMCSAS